MKLVFTDTRQQYNYYCTWNNLTSMEDAYPIFHMDVADAQRLLEQFSVTEWPLEDIVVLPNSGASKPALKRLLGDNYRDDII